MTRSGYLHRRGSAVLIGDRFNRSPAYQPILSEDNFIRANSTTSLGSTPGTAASGSADPLTWTAQDGTWGINSNQAYSPVLGSTAAGAIATVDLGTADAAWSAIKAAALSSLCGVVFRYSDNSNYWMARGGDSTHITLEKVVAGVRSTVVTSAQNFNAFGALRVVAIGSSIKVYFTSGGGQWNDNPIATTTDSFNSTATKFGLCSSSISARFTPSLALINPALPVGTDGGGLGSTDGSGLLDPVPWSQWPNGYGWAIVSNQAATPANAWNPNPCIATVNAQRADVDMSAKIAAYSDQAALVFRLADFENYWYWFSWKTSPRANLEKVVGGVTTVVSTFLTGAWSNGDIIRVVCVGSVLTGYVNGVQKWTVTDTDLQSNTRFGIYTQQEFPGSSPGGDPSVRWDDFTVALP